MRKHLLLAVAAVVGLGSVALAARPEQAPEPGPPGRPGRRPPAAMLKEELGLNEAQVGQLRKLRADQRKAAIRRRADMAIARMELDELLGAATVDDKAVSAKVKELSDLQAASLRARVDGRMALHRVLTPEQHEKMKELRPQRRMMEHRRRGPQGRRMGPPPGGRGPGDEAEDEEPDEGPPSR